MAWPRRWWRGREATAEVIRRLEQNASVAGCSSRTVASSVSPLSARDYPRASLSLTKISRSAGGSELTARCMKNATPMTRRRGRNPKSRRRRSSGSSRHKIPLRDWVYGRHYIRKYVSMTAAPGGVGVVARSCRNSRHLDWPRPSQNRLRARALIAGMGLERGRSQG